jgi:hypothetical protein
MIPRQPDPPAEIEFIVPRPGERRATVRHLRRFEMLWQVLGRPGRDLAQAEVFDVSATGVGLRCDKALPVEALLMLRLPAATTGWSSHLVRVKRCTQEPDGRFQVGCHFARPLTERQLEELLG